jgi:hypothetical protein
LSVKPVADCVHNCKANAVKLRIMAQNETNNNIKQMLLEAAHHLDLCVAELNYIVSNATVPV